MFSYGVPHCPLPDDPRFNTEDEAISAAVKLNDDDEVYAVWDDESGEILALVFAGMIYT